MKPANGNKSTGEKEEWKSQREKEESDMEAMEREKGKMCVRESGGMYSARRKTQTKIDRQIDREKATYRERDRLMARRWS